MINPERFTKPKNASIAPKRALLIAYLDPEMKEVNDHLEERYKREGYAVEKIFVTPSVADNIPRTSPES